MPGCGKSHWGNEVSKHFGWEYYDLDHEIEKHEGESVNGLFTLKGEDYFRVKERFMLRMLIEETKNSNVIISCGGGTPVMYNNLKIIKDSGCVVYLKAPYDILVKRLKESNRPMFENDSEVKQTLNLLLEHRIPFYEQADFTLDTDKITVESFGKIFERCTEQQ